VREKLKENNFELTGVDLVCQPGRENKLLERLQKMMNVSMEKIRLLIESISYNKDKFS
jgi:hypothetical protein